MNQNLMEKAVYDLLKAMGEDPNREGLKDTPKRVAKMYSEILSYPNFNYTTFEDKYDDLIMIKIIGLSKIARVVEKYSKKLQVQERMTEEIMEDLKKNLGTDNIAVYIEAKHMCMISRGVKKELTSTVTTKFSGSFKTERKSEFLFLLGKGN